VLASNENLVQSKDDQIHILTAKNNDKLKTAEDESSIKQAKQCEAAAVTSNQNLMMILALTISLIIMLIWLINHLKQLLIRNAEERKHTEKALEDIIQELKEKRQQLQLRNTSVSELVGYRHDAINELLESIKFKRVNTPEKSISIISLPKFISEVRDKYNPLKVVLSDQFWKNMKLSVDGEYKGIVSYVEKKYPNLSEKELKMFCLLCAKISPQLIKLCMNQSSAKSISNYRVIIVKQKMGLDMTLEEFIEKYMKNGFEDSSFSPQNYNVD